eukprot:350266-Chlamydomonas_euryale.AAC.10
MPCSIHLMHLNVQWLSPEMWLPFKSSLERSTSVDHACVVSIAMTAVTNQRAVCNDVDRGTQCARPPLAAYTFYRSHPEFDTENVKTFSA